jgi:hypothetical protein
MVKTTQDYVETDEAEGTRSKVKSQGLEVRGIINSYNAAI